MVSASFYWGQELQDIEESKSVLSTRQISAKSLDLLLQLYILFLKIFLLRLKNLLLRFRLFKSGIRVRNLSFHNPFLLLTFIFM